MQVSYIWVNFITLPRTNNHKLHNINLKSELSHLNYLIMISSRFSPQKSSFSN